MSFFKCSKYLLNRATQAKNERGILMMPAGKHRQGIAKEIKLQVVSLYEDDEYSRKLPGEDTTIETVSFHVLSKSSMLHSLNIHALKLDISIFLVQAKMVFVASTKTEGFWLMHAICLTER